MREDEQWQKRMAEGMAPSMILQKLDQLERGFDDIEHRITNIDREHSRYVKATVTRTGLFIKSGRRYERLVIQLLNRLSANNGDEDMIQAVGSRMNFPRQACCQKKLFISSAAQERTLQNSCRMKRNCRNFRKKRS